MSQGPVRIYYPSPAGRATCGRLVRGALRGVVVAGPVPPLGEPVRFSVEGPGIPRDTVEGLGRPARIAGADDAFGMRLLQLRSVGGAPPLREFMRFRLGADLRDVPESQVERVANIWIVVIDPNDEAAHFERLPRVTQRQLKQFLHDHAPEGVANLYFSLPVTYLINGVPYRGRSVRLSEVYLTVRTNTVLPGLGNHVEVQIPFDREDGREWFVVRGGVFRRSDQREASVLKGKFEVKIYDVEEIDRPGLFFEFLTERYREAARQHPAHRGG